MVKLQIPIDTAVRDGLAKRAEDLGFDSIQAFIRFWAKAEVEGRRVDFGEDWGEPTPEATARLNRIAEEAKRDYKAGKLKEHRTVEELMKDLRE